VVDLEAALPASPEQVFALISDHARLPEWAPFLRRVEVDVSGAAVAGGAGTLRTLHPKLGPPGRELILALEAPRRLCYSATDESLRGLGRAHKAELTIEPSGGGTRLRWVVEMIPPRGWARRLFARWMFRWAARRSIRNLQRHFAAAGNARGQTRTDPTDGNAPAGRQSAIPDHDMSGRSAGGR